MLLGGIIWQCPNLDCFMCLLPKMGWGTSIIRDKIIWRKNVKYICNFEVVTFMIKKGHGHRGGVVKGDG